MISRTFYSISLSAIVSLSACAQSVNCEALLSKELDRDMSTAIQNIKICGNFSDDDTLLLQRPIFAPQYIQVAQNKAATYNDLIAKLNEIRHNENYPMILQALKRERDSPQKTETPKPATIDFIQMSDYKLALKEATETNKPLFLYFTSKNSVQSRQMEKGLLADHEVKAVLNHFVRYSANVDDPTVEKFQIEKFKADVQPYFVVVINDDKVVDFTGSTKDKTEFIEFLKKGLR